jgi:hypothetical protein
MQQAILVILVFFGFVTCFKSHSVNLKEINLIKCYHALEKSGYGLNDRAIEVRSRQRRKNFSSSLCVHTSSGAHPASCTIGTAGLFPGLKRGRGVTLTTDPYLVPRSRMSRSYYLLYPPPKRLLECRRIALAFMFWRKLSMP